MIFAADRAIAEGVKNHLIQFFWQFVDIAMSNWIIGAFVLIFVCIVAYRLFFVTKEAVDGLEAIASGKARPQKRRRRNE